MKKKQKNSDISDISLEESFFTSSVVQINDSTAVCKTLNHQKWRENKTHFGLRFWRRSDGPKLGVSRSQRTKSKLTTRSTRQMRNKDETGAQAK